MSPGDLRLLGFVISYDNSIILPVSSQTYSDISIVNTTVQNVTTAPFSLLAGDFNLPLDTWLVRGGRTGFSFDFMATDAGLTPYMAIDVFAFYYRVADNDMSAVNAATFRLEDGRDTESMVGSQAQVSFIRPGVEILSGGITYVLGHNVAGYAHNEIPDVNVTGIMLASEALALPEETPEPEATLAPPQETAAPAVTSTPSPAPTPTPGQNAPPTPVATLSPRSQTEASPYTETQPPPLAVASAQAETTPGYVTVTFDASGGEFPPNENGVRTGPPGFVIDVAPYAPTLAYNQFLGWSYNDNPVTFPLTVTANMVLTARWQNTGPQAATPSPTPAATPTPTTTPAPSSPMATPTPAATGGGTAGQNPQTSPIHISFAIFGAVLAVGLAAFGIIKTANKQKLATKQYSTEIKRYNREQRIEDMTDSSKPK